MGGGCLTSWFPQLHGAVCTHWGSANSAGGAGDVTWADLGSPDWMTAQLLDMSGQQRSLAETAGVVHVKSKFHSEYRRFGLKCSSGTGCQDFYKLLLSIHQIPGVDVFLAYVDFQGKLLPINNDASFQSALSLAQPLLRLVLQQKDEEHKVFVKKRKRLGVLWPTEAKPRLALLIGPPMDFHLVSSIIDVDILPETLRRVWLHKCSSNMTLGFYIRDGVSIRTTPEGVEKVEGIFISRVVPGGLAASTGLLSVDDEVVEVNGIKVAGKSLDQVTDMMVANSHCLVITVRPENQCNSMVCHSLSSRVSAPDSAYSPVSQLQVINSVKEGESDNEENDLIIEHDGL